MQSLAKDKNMNSEASNLLQFIFLPQYSKFLLENKLEEYVGEQLRISKEIGLPMLKHLEAMPEAEVIRVSSQGAKELLQFFSENKVQEFIDRTLQLWKANTLPIIQSEE